jgi:hypothetical protein
MMRFYTKWLCSIIVALVVLAGASVEAATVTHLLAHPDTANGSSYDTATAPAPFTPTVNDLLVVTVVATGTTAVTPTLTDSQTLGFTLITSSTRGGDALYVFVANGLAAASSTTLVFTCTEDAATGVVFLVAGVSGMSKTGATAVKQSKAANGAAGTTPAATFDSAVLTENPTLVFLGNNDNPAGVTQPTGWTEQADTGHITPTGGAEYATRDSGFTGTTVTWGSSSVTQHYEAVIELDTSSTALPEGNCTMTLLRVGVC